MTRNKYSQIYAEDEENSDKKSVVLLESISELLKNGENEIKLDETHKSLVLVVGKNRNDKSIFIRWIAGYEDKLVAKEITRGEFLIEDESKTGNSTKKSFPELVTNTGKNISYYDCSAFDDTDNASYNIAAGILTKEILDHADNIKIVLTINHASVRRGASKQNITKILQQATALIKNIDKVENSVGLVVTNVDNLIEKQGTNWILLEDNAVKSAIVDFLKDVRQDFSKDSLTKKNENIIKLMDSFLKKDGDNFSKIGLFRKPDESGPLNKIVLLQEGKKKVEFMIDKKLNFTTKSQEDFGYAMSEKSLDDVKNLIADIKQNISTDLIEVAKEIKSFYQNSTESILTKIKSIISQAFIPPEMVEARTLSFKINNKYESTMRFVEDMKYSQSIEELIITMSNSSSQFSIEIKKEIITSLKIQKKYLMVLQPIIGSEIKMSTWVTIFEEVSLDVNQSRENLQKEIEKMAQTINDSIRNFFISTTKAMQEHFEDEAKSREIQMLPVVLNEGYRVMSTMLKEFKNIKNERNLTELIYEKAKDLGIYISKNNLPNLLISINYLDFLQTLSDKKLENALWTGLFTFYDLVQFLDDLKKWYTFLNDVFVKFSQYEIQKARYKYNVANIEDWGKSGKSQGIQITKKNIFEFFKNLEKTNNIKFDNNTSIEIGDAKLYELNHVLKRTLTSEVNINCSDTAVKISGDYISLKRLNSLNNTFVNFSEKCGDTCLELRTGKYKSVHISALNTIFIDKSLSLAGIGAQLTIISPKWEVIGTQKIEVNGFNADSPNDFKALNIFDCEGTEKNVTYVRKAPEVGKPGKPGGPGGEFLGIGEHFVNGENLLIYANGGKGGTGQIGGVGKAGKDGYDAKLPPVNGYCGYNECKDGRKLYTYTCSYVDSSFKSGGATSTATINYKIFGGKGEVGEAGGDGGSGGRGGHPGSILLFELFQPSEVSKQNNTGDKGVNGEGGIGGPGGYNGDDLLTHCTITKDFSQMYNQKTYFFWGLDKTIHNSRQQQGKKGRDGGNVKGIENPSVRVKLSEPYEFINEFKKYLRENIDDRLRKSYLIQFLNHIESNKNIKKVYDSIGFAEELKGLEEQQYSLKDKVDFTPFYRSLLNRISDFAKELKDEESKSKNRKFLNYMYTAILGKFYNLENKSDYYLIIDINEHLKSIEKDIKTLNSSKEKRNRVEIIEKYKNDYKKNIDTKVNEAKNLIGNAIVPEIDTIRIQIDDNIDLLITESIALKKKVESVKEDLIEKKKQLAKSLQLRGLINSFKIAGNVLSFLGPVGEVVGSFIGGIGSVSEDLVLNTNHQIDFKLPPGIESSLRSLQDGLKREKYNKVTQLKNLLDEMQQETSKHPEVLSDITSKIIENKGKLENIRIESFNFKIVREVYVDIKREITSKEDTLRNEITSDKKVPGVLSVLSKINNVLKLTKISFDLYNKYKKDREKLNTIDAAIEKADNTIQDLTKYEDNIYQVVIPKLEDMGNDLLDITTKLSNKSKVSLDVIKWKVQGTLRDVKLEMKQLTEGFDVRDNMARCLEKLEEAMVTLINVYDRMQSYQEQQNLANYIADVTSVTANKIDVGPKFNTILNKLDILIGSNLIVKQYKIAIDAFKQWVFPFSHLYLEQIILPEQLEVKDNVEDLATTVSTQIENIKMKVSKYKQAVSKYDDYLHNGEFNSRYVSTKPFFVWKNEQNQGIISKLLSGEKVVFKADITKSPFDKDAIKFNFIDFNFKSQNDTIQKGITTAMKGFQISATHLGNSYYRCGDKYYVITSDSHTIRFSFEKNGLGVPVDKNNVYDKLKEGDLMLSPYAAWEIQLINSTDMSFEELKTYGEIVDIELEGHGSYVTKDVNLTSLIIEDEYKEFISGSNTELNSELNSEHGISESGSDISLFQDNEIRDARDYTQLETSSSFLWLKLPSFNILPGAEAATIELSTSLDDEDGFTFFGKIEEIVKNCITSLKEYLVPRASTSEYMQPTEILSANYSSYIKNNDNSLSSKPKISFDTNKTNEMEQVIDIVDINGNLVLGQIIAHKVFGNNESLKSTQYLSPSLEHEMKINKLASEVIHILEKDDLPWSVDDDYEAKYDKSQQGVDAVAKDDSSKSLETQDTF